MSNEENALVPIDEKEVEFYGDELTAVLISTDKSTSEIYVPVRPMCEYMGLVWSGQYERIRRDQILSEAMRFVRVTRTNRGGNPNLLCLPLKFIPGWLFGIQVNRIREELRDKILRYQRECYDVLWEAFQSGRLTTDIDLMKSDSPAVQAYHLAMAVADLARNQVLMEERLTGRMDNYETRLEVIEATLGNPERYIDNAQAMQISQAVKAIALEMSKLSGRNEYGGVYGELYRRFEISSYKLLPAARFEEAMEWLREWYSSLVGEAPF